MKKPLLTSFYKGDDTKTS